jgi:hypothetical protein
VPVLLCGLLVLVAAEAPGTLRAGDLPQTFDGSRALRDARTLALRNPDRSPGSGGSIRAANQMEQRFRAERLSVSRQRFEGKDASGDPVSYQNVLAVFRPAGIPPGPLRAVFVLAHRDDISPGPGANDNASGSAVLLELGAVLPSVLQNTAVVLVSTDGATAGNAGARYLARHPPPGLQPQAVLVLTGVGTPTPVRIRIGGEDTRLAAAGLVRSVETGLRDDGVADVRLPGLATQLLGLIAPLGVGEQAPFVRRGIPAVTVDGVERGLAPADDTPDRLNAQRLQAVGDTVQRLVVAVDDGGAPASPARSYLIAADRVVRGWTLELFLVTLLVPPALVLFDLLPRCARWRVPLRGALRQWLLRAVPGVVFVCLLRLEGVFGVVDGPEHPPFPGSGAGLDTALILPVLGFGLTWLFLRRARRPLRGDPSLAGVASFAAAVAGTFVAAIVALVGSPYLLALVVPALHVWLGLPALQRLGVVARLGAVAVGFLPLILLVWLLAGPGEIGAASAVPWLLRLIGAGTLSLAGALALVLIAAAGIQLGALAFGRVAGAR